MTIEVLLTNVQCLFVCRLLSGGPIPRDDFKGIGSALKEAGALDGSSLTEVDMFMTMSHDYPLPHVVGLVDGLYSGEVVAGSSTMHLTC